MDIHSATEEAYKKGYEDGKPKWIPVTERLPDEDGEYLVYKRIWNSGWCDVVGFAKDGRKVDKYDFTEIWENVWYIYDSEWGHLVSDSVTHWMPLPKPPNCGAKMNLNL